MSVAKCEPAPDNPVDEPTQGAGTNQRLPEGQSTLGTPTLSGIPAVCFYPRPFWSFPTEARGGRLMVSF